MPDLRTSVTDVLTLCACCVLGALAAATSSAQPAPSGGEFRGFLTSVWGDARPGGTGDGGLRFALTYPDGTETPVEISTALRSAAIGLSGKRVVVRGAATGDRSDRRIVARSIEAAEDEERRRQP